MSGEAPEGWRVMRLSQIAELSLGKMLDKDKNKGEMRPYLANINVRWGSFDLQNLREMRFEDREIERYSLRSGDIVMCEGGEPGRCALWLEDEAGTMIQKALHRIRPMDGIDSHYLYFALAQKGSSGAFAEYLTGGGIKHLPGEKLAMVELSIPPLDEQWRIAEVLRSVDKAVAANQLATHQSELTLKMSMAAALHVTSRAPPSHWRNVQIRELGKVQAGRQRAPSFTSGEVRPYLRVANVFDGYIDDSDVLAMPFTDREFLEYQLMPGDILLNEGQSLHLVGRAAIYEGQPANCCFQNTLVRFRAEAVSSLFAYALTRTLYWTGQLSAIATQTTSVAHLGVSRFASLRVALPPEDEQEQIANTFLALSSASESLKAAGMRLRELRSALVDDLLSGRIRVPA